MAMAEKEPLLISGCMLGLCCRFDGESKPMRGDLLHSLREKFALIPVCPEQLGGLATPREPSEFDGTRFFSRTGEDVTEHFQKGAEEALRLARFFGCKRALLKEKSPSCGFGKIYDGSFQKKLVDGNGAAAELLFQNGIAIYGETRINELLEK